MTHSRYAPMSHCSTNIAHVNGIASAVSTTMIASLIQNETKRKRLRQFSRPSLIDGHGYRFLRRNHFCLAVGTPSK